MAPRRFKIYTICFVVSVLVFLSNIFGSFSQSLLFLAFSISSFFLVFTIEVLPKQNTDIPQIHFYQKSRLNSYTYWMLVLFIVTALVYYILTGVFRMNESLSVIILWPACIYLSNFIYEKTASIVPLEMINDYLRTDLNINPTYEENKLINEMIKEMLPTFYGDMLDKQIEKFEKEFEKKGLSREFFEKAVQSIYEYLELNSDKLTSDEIMALDEEPKISYSHPEDKKKKN